MTLSVAQRARRFPDRTAVVDVSEERLYAPAETVHEDRVTYAELSELADDVAARLAALTVDAGDTVALVTRNRVASLALFFACRRLGATFAPISHRLTPVTVERPFDAISPEIVVFEAAQRDLVRSIPHDRSITLEKLATVALDARIGAERTAGLTELDDDVGSDSTAGDDDRPLLVLHGEGGRPAAAFSERSLERTCASALVTWGLSADDVAPVVTPLSAADGFVRVALPLLYVGGRLLLDRAFDPGDTLAAIETEGATFLAGRTITFRELATESGFDDAVGSLERAVPDHSVPATFLEPYRERDVTVTRAYGRLECPTALCETDDAVGSGSDGVADCDDAVGSTGTAVGVPVPDCRVRLVDEDGTALAGSGTGRLQLSGPVVADGYVNAAASTDADGSDEWDAVDRTTEREAGDSAGEFVDGWFDAGDRVRRDDRGVYVLE
ncbi:class I adenylate-forming enzyme family protein [Natrarchaeobius oligotrophus]|uniref:Long-chain fatty acid--CoA ligase n=1 Tax=Natrarchaeobius chitinivorans TaxID=1679083 RepID=A0A3N6MSX8_NATCH|nr:AMP-binding protein [Natrarchaeobius chitinivorans]RQH00941.1 long-chain fatty acid--CoA ligase [Natrarchaeobius chitinivorans]